MNRCVQAEAFAETFAAAQDCNCDVAVRAEASVWADIWVEAAANAYAEACVGAPAPPPSSPSPALLPWVGGY